MDRETQTKFKSLIRIGIVSSVNAQKYTARVYFDDRDGVVSDELQILTPCASQNKTFALPDVNEAVVCLFATNDESSGNGFIIGSIYNELDTIPLDGNENRAVTRYADGTQVMYDRASHTMTIECVGDLTIKAAGNVTICGRRIDLNP